MPEFKVPKENLPTQSEQVASASRRVVQNMQRTAQTQAPVKRPPNAGMVNMGTFKYNGQQA